MAYEKAADLVVAFSHIVGDSRFVGAEQLFHCLAKPCFIRGQRYGVDLACHDVAGVKRSEYFVGVDNAAFAGVH